MKGLASLLTGAVLPLGALCFRLSEHTPGAGEPPGTNESFIAELDDPSVLPVDDLLEESFVTKVPPIDVYRRVWTKRYSLERHLQEPLPSSIQMILGVFTVAQDAEYRHVVRQTWMQQAGVCYWKHGPWDNCSVYVAFVIGKHGSGSSDVNVTDEEVERAHKEEGMLVLDVPENMNRGKSLTWFHTARGWFPWATHIAKMDMDTYPFLHKLLKRMDSNRSCVNNNGQYEFIGRPHNTYGRNFTEYCPYEECHGQFLSRQDDAMPVAVLHGPWKFLSGEFYILSFPLVQMLPWTQQRGGNEDLFVSGVVNRAAKENGFCVTLRRLDAWLHRNTWVDGAYSNDF
eukprot:CAMPEP_0171104914 /NCGR_PEP_ID=MMETSP0766_2-20121228/61579_1 /TAXON_ID=439317 /ORGANISM="Gambierdiscus australes, Strain CAWD 149" /LENGTH=341 /DNA_ID=CAMNT_0011565627 /DNA_START=43 /DNA_END=1068 /DNA_ORIENTATION=+